MGNQSFIKFIYCRWISIKYIVVYLILAIQSPSNVFGQVERSVDDMRFSPGISLEKNVVDLKSFEFGVNLFAKRGGLTSDVINFFGFEAGYKWISLVQENCSGVNIRAIYQYGKGAIGFNLQNSVLLARKSSFFLPEIGLNWYGVISLNYGYYFSMNQKQNYDPSLHSVSLRFNLNTCYIAYLNMVGKSERWRLKKKR